MKKTSNWYILFLTLTVILIVYIATISIPAAFMFVFYATIMERNSDLLKTNTAIRQVNITLLKENSEMLNKLKEAATILAQRQAEKQQSKDIIVPSPRFKELPDELQDGSSDNG